MITYTKQLKTWKKAAAAENRNEKKWNWKKHNLKAETTTIWFDDEKAKRKELKEKKTYKL
jgi:hypothetical protein